MTSLPTSLSTSQKWLLVSVVIFIVAALSSFALQALPAIPRGQTILPKNIKRFESKTVRAQYEQWHLDMKEAFRLVAERLPDHGAPMLIIREVSIGPSPTVWLDPDRALMTGNTIFFGHRMRFSQPSANEMTMMSRFSFHLAGSEDGIGCATGLPGGNSARFVRQYGTWKIVEWKELSMSDTNRQ